MKTCPKCGIEHNKKGIYCSRHCANSRKWTSEQNSNRSQKLKGRVLGSEIKDKEKWKENIRKTRLEKYNNTPFEELGCENRKRRVLEEQNNCCNKCKLSEWFGSSLTLELEHKDGNTENNERSNLECLCPNCHSLTETWRGRNKPAKNGTNKLSDEELLAFLKNAKNIRRGLLDAGLAAKGKNYERAKRLLGD